MGFEDVVYSIVGVTTLLVCAVIIYFASVDLRKDASERRELIKSWRDEKK